MKILRMLVASAVSGTALVCLALASPAQAASVAPAQALLQPWPVTVKIRTVPALPGVHFTFDGAPLVTGRDGVASHTERHNFARHTLRLVSTRIEQRNRRYKFSRWAGQRNPDLAFVSSVPGLPMRANYTVTASFSVQCAVTPQFIDQTGYPLDRRRIAQVTVRADTGSPAALQSAGKSWLRCARVVYRDSILSVRRVRYSVQRVMFSGTNVVHAGVERFSPERNAGPVIVGYFHNLTISAHDAMFGGATGILALVTLPNHSILRVPLGADHLATLRYLPQGNYWVQIRAGSAIVSGRAVRLSKNETVDLTAVSAADIATIVGSVIFIMTALPLMSGARRKRLAGLLLRRWRREAAPA